MLQFTLQNHENYGNTAIRHHKKALSSKQAALTITVS